MRKVLIFLSLMLLTCLVACTNVTTTKTTTKSESKTMTTDNKVYEAGLTKLSYSNEYVFADYVINVDKTGNKDVTDEIQQVITECFKNGGGTIFIPKGNYLITKKIRVLSFCYLVGEYNDPDLEGFNGDYGTVFVADPEPSSVEERSSILADREDIYTNFESLFEIGGSAALMNATIYYKNQDINSVTPYPFTIEIPSFAANGAHINHHASTVKNITMINSYKGLIAGASASSEFSGGYAAAFEQVHIENVKGTFLYQGFQMYIASEAGVVKGISISNDYWQNYALDSNEEIKLDEYTMKYTTGMLLGDLEWLFFDNITIKDVSMGIRIYDGIRRFFTNEMYFIGQFYKLSISNTNTAMRIDNMYFNFGITIADSYLEGRVYSLNERDNTTAKVKIINTNLVGDIYGNSLYYSGFEKEYKELYNKNILATTDIPDIVISNDTLFLGKDYNVDNTAATDASNSIQQALDDAHTNGGGIVYLEAGYYLINNPLIIYDNTELRGCASAATRDQIGKSLGTVLLGNYGYGTISEIVKNDTALVTIQGNNSGIRGIRFIYPENKPAPGTQTPIKLHSYVVRVLGDNTYLKCLSFVGVPYGVEVLDSNNVLLSEISGTYYLVGVHVADSNNVTCDELIENAAVVARIGYSLVKNLQQYFLIGWPTDGNGGLSKMYQYITRPNTEFFVVDNSENVKIINSSAFGIKTFYHGTNSTSYILCCNSDNCSSYIWDVSGGSLTSVNMFKYNDVSTFRAQNNAKINAFNTLTLHFTNQYTLDPDYLSNVEKSSVLVNTSTKNVDDLPLRYIK